MGMDTFPSREPTIDDVRKWVGNRITELKIDFEVSDEEAFRKSLQPLWNEVQTFNDEDKHAVVLALVQSQLVIPHKPVLNNKARQRLENFRRALDTRPRTTDDVPEGRDT